MMAGLVAILADQRNAGAGPAELDAFVRAYRSLRPDPEHARMVAGKLALASLLGGAEDANLGVERRNGSWAIHVGGLHGQDGGALDTAPDRLDGQFALLRYREQADELELLSDPFGLQALYLARRDGLSYVSTSVLALAKHLRLRPDRLGLEVFMRSGPHFGELTNWEGAGRLAPGTRVVFGRGRRGTSTYWRPELDRTLAANDRRAAALECIERSAAAFRDRYGAQQLSSWCDLTGGYDTRLGALLLRHAGVRFATTTNGAADDPDVLIAKDIAARGGWGWTRGTLPRDWPTVCERALPAAVAWGDGMLEATQLAGVMALQSACAREATVLFSGGGGEHWRDYAWKQELPLAGRTKHVSFERWVAVRFLHPIDCSAFRSDPTGTARENLVRRCRDWVAPYADERGATQLDLLYALKSMAHFGAYQSAARGTIRVELPFYAKQAFSGAVSVAPRHRNWHRLARAAIELLDADIAAFPTTHGDPATPLRATNVHRFAPFVAVRARGAARKLTQNLPGPTLGAVRVHPDDEVLGARRRALSQFLARTHADPSRMRSGPLYDATGLRRLAHSPTATTGGWRTLGRIITAELAMEAAERWLD
jgi:hypothetical protein